MRFIKLLLIAASIISLSCGREELDSLPVYFISGGQVYSIDFNGGNLKRLTNDANTYESVSSSMDGEDILLSDSSGKMYVMNYKGGTPVYFMDGRFGTYGPSGNIYFALKDGTSHNTIARSDPSGNNITSLKLIDTNAYIMSISVSYDETELATHYQLLGPSYSIKINLLNLGAPVTSFNGGIGMSYSTLNKDILVYNSTFLRITRPDTTYSDVYTSTYSSLSLGAWSPDVSFIFFAYNDSNPKEIRRIKSDGTEMITLGYFNTAINTFCVLGKPR